MAKRAVVLGGGGSRGAYQMGVWRAMRELGMDYQIVTGSSVGALNGVMMVQQDYDGAKALWESIHNEDVMDLPEPMAPVSYEEPGWERRAWGDFLRSAMQSRGVDSTPLETFLQDYVKEDLVRTSPIEFGLVTVEFPAMRAKELTKAEIPQGKLTDYLMASCACFPAFRTKKIGETQFIDGGYHDNMPISLAVRLGAQEIIAVDIKGVGVYRRPVKGLKITTIRSHWDLGPFLWFEPTLSKRNMELGYLDAMRAFGALEGNWYAWTPGEAQKLDAVGQRAFLELTQRLKLDDTANPMARMLRRKLLKILLEHPSAREEQDRLPWGVLARQAAELAAECLGLPPLKVYTFASLCRETLSRFRRRQQDLDVQQALALLQGKKLPALDRLKEIAALGQVALVSLFQQELEGVLQGTWNPLLLWPQLALFPKEFLIACFFWWIQQHPQLWQGALEEGHKGE